MLKAKSKMQMKTFGLESKCYFIARKFGESGKMSVIRQTTVN